MINALEDEIAETAFGLSLERPSGSVVDLISKRHPFASRETILAGIEVATDICQALADTATSPVQETDLLNQLLWLEKPLVEQEEADRRKRAFPKPQIVK